MRDSRVCKTRFGFNKSLDILMYDWASKRKKQKKIIIKKTKKRPARIINRINSKAVVQDGKVKYFMSNNANKINIYIENLIKKRIKKAKRNDKTFAANPVRDPNKTAPFSLFTPGGQQNAVPVIIQPPPQPPPTNLQLAKASIEAELKQQLDGRIADVEQKFIKLEEPLRRVVDAAMQQKQTLEQLTSPQKEIKERQIEGSRASQTRGSRASQTEQEGQAESSGAQTEKRRLEGKPSIKERFKNFFSPKKAPSDTEFETGSSGVKRSADREAQTRGNSQEQTIAEQKAIQESFKKARDEAASVEEIKKGVEGLAQNEEEEDDADYVKYIGVHDVQYKREGNSQPITLYMDLSDGSIRKHTYKTLKDFKADFPNYANIHRTNKTVVLNNEEVKDLDQTFRIGNKLIINAMLGPPGMLIYSGQPKPKVAPKYGSGDGDEEKDPNKRDFLYDTELNEMMKNYSCFAGTIMRDELKEVLQKALDEGWDRFCLVINTEPSSKDGEHWTALYIDLYITKEIAFFDPFGEEPAKSIQDDLKWYVDQLKLPHLLKYKVNSNVLQHDRSQRCGYHCVKFLENMINGKGFANSTGFKDKMTKSEYEEETKKKMPEYKERLGFGYI